jgi:hypothetical protein
MPWSFRQSSVVLNCLKASAGTKRRARRKRLGKTSAPRYRFTQSSLTAEARHHG